MRHAACCTTGISYSTRRPVDAHRYEPQAVRHDKSITGGIAYLSRECWVGKYSIHLPLIRRDVELAEFSCLQPDGASPHSCRRMDWAVLVCLSDRINGGRTCRHGPRQHRCAARRYRAVTRQCWTCRCKFALDVTGSDCAARSHCQHVHNGLQASKQRLSLPTKKDGWAP